MGRVRNELGQFGSNAQEVIDDAVKRRKDAAKKHGYDIKEASDYHEEMIESFRKAHILKESEIDDFGFEKDFARFLGFGKPRNYHVQLKKQYQIKSKPRYIGKTEDFVEDLVEDSREFYTPLDDFYGTPSGGDMVSDFGRVPTSHLVSLCTQRLGIANRVCWGTANDVLKNGFDFVSDEDPEKIVKKPEIMRWMRKSRFLDKFTETLNFNFQTGLGHLIPKFPNEKGMRNAANKIPKTRPNNWEAFSSYHMTPANLGDFDDYDYSKQDWDFIGGTRNVSLINHTRVYVLEIQRVEGGLRGLSYPEIVWTPLMCYLNTMYYILKSLGQLGTSYTVFESAKEFPTKEETDKYIELGNLMRANKTFVMGKNAQFRLENAAAKIGQGIESYLEFLREDISAGWIYPKNQLFGRAEGGGLEGAGAIISKEDYLGSNISTKQLLITNDIMDILTNMCGFKDLENLTLRWKIDLHKSEEQRLKERMMRAQAEMTEVQLDLFKLNAKLQTDQIKLQREMAKVQMKMFKQNPEGFMQQSQKDEENLEEKEAKTKQPQKDFLTDFTRLEMLKDQYMKNINLMSSIQNSIKENQNLMNMNKSNYRLEFNK